MNQKLADWASIADIVGAIAVTMSLIFVGLEIRGNTKATQAATLQQSVGYDVTLLTTFGSNPDIAATFTKYVGGEPELTESQRLQGQYFFAAALGKPLFAKTGRYSFGGGMAGPRSGGAAEHHRPWISRSNEQSTRRRV
jgi:hypothetical protein